MNKRNYNESFYNQIFSEKEKKYKENPKLLSEREQFWIEHYNSIENGYNARNEVASETAKTTT